MENQINKRIINGFKIQDKINKAVAKLLQRQKKEQKHNKNKKKAQRLV